MWEVVATWKAIGEDPSAFAAEYPWLEDCQLRAALRYYAAYPAEIDARLAGEEFWTPERVRTRFPFLRAATTMMPLGNEDTPDYLCLVGRRAPPEPLPAGRRVLIPANTCRI